MSCKVTVTKDHAGRRLDHMLRSIWPEIPLSAVMRALRRGQIRLDAVCAREGRTRVNAGQELYVPWAPPGTRTPARAYPPLPVVWQGENALVLNKPADLLVQPDVKNGDSVVTRLRSMFPDRMGPGFAPAAVHRLDRNTTGALIVALSGGALRGLENLFRERRIDKRYIAVVAGLLPEKGLISAPLEKDALNNTVRVNARGKTARTRYLRLAGDSELSLAWIELLTGRTHQARVHLAHIGHPVLGDRKYGDIETNRIWRSAARRPLLHSYELTFPEDIDRDGDLAELAGRTFRAELPPDMKTFLKERGWETPAQIL